MTKGLHLKGFDLRVSTVENHSAMNPSVFGIIFRQSVYLSVYLSLLSKNLLKSLHSLTVSVNAEYNWNDQLAYDM